MSKFNFYILIKHVVFAKIPELGNDPLKVLGIVVGVDRSLIFPAFDKSINAGIG